MRGKFRFNDTFYCSTAPLFLKKAHFELLTAAAVLLVGGGCCLDRPTAVLSSIETVQHIYTKFLLEGL